MKRIHVLLVVLIVLLLAVGAIRWIFPGQITMPSFLSGPRTPIIDITNNQLTPPSKEAGTGAGMMEGSGDVAVTGSIDDTELPLDQGENNLSGGADEQPTDPEVEEIIDLLEELIAESENQ